MLVEFSTGNYCSFKDVVTLSMVAANLRAKNKELDQSNVFPTPHAIKLLKSAVIYGANASGKSNLVRAMGFMRRFVLDSSRESRAEELIGVEHFRLSTETERAPSYFQMIFYLEGKRYRYGFEVDDQRVHSEWLYHTPNRRETRVFIRKGDEFDLSSTFKEGRGLTGMTRGNVLFLSVVAQFNGQVALSISKWFSRLGIISGLSDREYRDFTIRKFEADEDLRDDLLSFIKEVDRITLSEAQPSIPKELLQGMLDMLDRLGERGIEPDRLLVPVVRTLHEKYDDSGVGGAWELFDIEQESEGTQKIFYLSGPLLATLRSGQVLIVDELDARLHPLITRHIVERFNSGTANPRNAQLIFATHDTNLLTNQIFRRDQIWFTEKDERGATDLYSLAEYRVRNDASYAKDYIAGKYGAIPFLGGVQHLIEDADGG
jgi:AAA15 family ATPase/GTPase